MAEPHNDDLLGDLRAAVDHLRKLPGVDDGPPGPTDWGGAASKLGGLAERVRTEVAARRSAFVEPRAMDPDWPEPPLPVSRDRPIDFRSEYALDELLGFEEADFVRNAYRAVVHREPDPGGYAMFFGILNAGASKVDLLALLASSDEARRVGVRVHGLRFAKAMQRVRTFPVVGRFFALAQYVWSLPWLLRRLERQERELARSERQLREAIDALGDFARETSSRSFAAIDTLERDKASRAAAMALTGRVATLQRDIAARATREAAQRIALRQQVLRLADSTLSVSGALAARLDASSAALGARLDASSGALAARIDASSAALTASSGALAARIDASSAALAARLDASLTRDGIEALLAEDDHKLDAFYSAFEESFRGSAEDITQRMEVYVPIVKEAVSPDAPILDLGCGRGEWLTVLRESGFAAARGVDLNGGMVDHCRSLGLQVEHGEMIAHLRSLESDSLGAVTGMHVIEHVSFRRMIELLDQTLRVLRPGGIAIFETPNPENLIVGACNFWYDPTHQRPLAPEPTKATFALRGFSDVRTLPLHPFPPEVHLPIRQSALRDRLNHILYGPQDYALICFKPAEAATP